MKKFIAMLTCFVMLMACTGCGAADQSGDLAVLTYRLDQAEERIAKLEDELSAMKNTAKEPEVEKTEQTQGEVEELPSSGADSSVTDKFVSILKLYRDSAAYEAVVKHPEHIRILNGLSYQCKNLEGHKAELLIMCIESDVEKCGTEKFHLIYDLSSGQIHDEITLDINNYTGNLATYEDILTALLNAYSCILMDDENLMIEDEIVYTDMEWIEELSADDLAVINHELE